MRGCPRCGSERLSRSHTRWSERPHRWISGALVYRCRECRWRGWDPDDRTPDSRGAWSPLGLATIASIAVAITVLIAVPLLVKSRLPPATMASGSRDQQITAPPILAQSPSLALVSSRAYQDPGGDFWNISGEIKNLTREPLTNLQVVSTWFDRQGQAIDEHVDLVDLKQMMPGAISTFRSVVRARPEMATFRLEFHSDRGTRLFAQDSSQTP